MEYLADWSSAANIDLDRELGRYLDEHLSMFVRPQPAITRVIRSLAASHQLVGVSVLPPRAVESICRHTGVWRSLATVIANGASAPQDAAVISTVSELEASLVAS
jgi:hypothetical protein